MDTIVPFLDYKSQNWAVSSFREEFDFGCGTDSLVAFEDQQRRTERDTALPAYRKPGFASQCNSLQCFPPGEVPAGKAVPVEVPGVVHMAPGPHVRLELLRENRLDEVPVPVVVKG